MGFLLPMTTFGTKMFKPVANLIQQNIQRAHTTAIQRDDELVSNMNKFKTGNKGKLLGASVGTSALFLLKQKEMSRNRNLDDEKDVKNWEDQTGKDLKAQRLMKDCHVWHCSSPYINNEQFK